jgi:Family of unknown function (DUF6266)
MGRIKKGILGGFAGQVGPVIGGTWKGVEYMRSKPTSVANPNTTGQQNQRNKFRGVVAVASILLGNIIQPLWNPIAKGMSGFNEFVSKNTEAFTTAGVLIANSFKSTFGSLLGSPISSSTATAATDTIVINFPDNSGVGNALATDKTVVVWYNQDQDYWNAEVGTTTRSGATVSVTDDKMVSTDTLELYLSFYRDGNLALASTSIHATEVVV